MSQVSDWNDALRAIRELQRQVRDLQRANPLNFSSVTGGTGIGIRTPLGVHIESGGSFAADQLRIDRAVGGSLRTPGNVEAGYLKSTGDTNTDGIVRGYGGVMAPIDGAMQQLGPRVGAATSAASAAQSRADSAYDLANSKPTKAYVDAGDAGADSKAGEALLKAGQAMAKSNEVIDYVQAVDTKIGNAISAIWDKILSHHPGGTKPGYSITPPPVKG